MKSSGLFLGMLLALPAVAARAGTPLVVSTTTFTDASDADFIAGARTNVAVSGGKLSLATDNGNVDNNGFENGLTGWDTNGQPSLVVDSPENYAGVGSRYLNMVDFVIGSPVLTFQILDPSNNILSSQTCAAGASWAPCVFTTSLYAGRDVKFNVSAYGSFYRTTTPFSCSGGNVTLYARFQATEAFPGSGFVIYESDIFFDEVTGGRNTIATGAFTSRTFDNGASAGAWLPSSASISLNGNAVSFQTQTSNDGTTWDAPAAWTPGAPPASLFKRYARYTASFSTGAGSTGTPSIDDVTLSAALLAQDIGLRAFDGSKTITLLAEPDGAPTSPLRIAKNGTTYGVMLVDPAHPQASKLRVMTASGVKSLRKYP